MVPANPGRSHDNNGQENHKDVWLRTSSSAFRGLEWPDVKRDTSKGPNCGIKKKTRVQFGSEAMFVLADYATVYCLGSCIRLTL